MKIKRDIGSVLTWLGIDGLIYGMVLIINTSSDGRDIHTLVIFSILGFIFFIAGVGLMRIKKGVSRYVKI
jgi:hypothetical protein